MEEKSDPVEYELKPAYTKDDAITGVWFDENNAYHLKLNEDMTFEFGWKSDTLVSKYNSETVYGKGDYIITKNSTTGDKYLFLSPKSAGTDYSVWEDVPEEEVGILMSSFPTRTRYILNNDTLTVFTFGLDDSEIKYNKATASNIKWE